METPTSQPCKKRSFYERIQPKLIKLKPAVIIGFIIVLIGMLLLYMRNKNSNIDGDPNRVEDIEVSYVGSILFVGLAMVFI